jgi:ornithine carbamoyltransferase
MTQPTTPDMLDHAHNCMPHIVKLNIDSNDINAFMTLHTAVTNNIPYVKKRTAEDIQNHIKNGHYAIGIFGSTGPMIGQALVTLPNMPGTTNLNGYPFGDDDITTENTVIIQSLGIDPAHKDCGLSKQIFHQAFEITRMKKRKYIIGKMNAENITSYNAFKKAGYKQYGSPQIVEGENYASVFMLKNIEADFIQPLFFRKEGVNAMPKDFINLSDIPAVELKNILKHAHAMKASKMAPDQVFFGLSLAMIFDKPSTRTRVSFEVGFKQLGGHTIVLNKNEIQLGHAETIKDTACVLSRMADAVMIRISDHTQVEEFAHHATIPVINALTNASHPCQIMADIMTIEEKKGRVAGLNITWLGDYNNVAKTFVEAASIFNFNLTLALPPDLHPHNLPDSITLTNDAQNAVIGADVIITDTWASMGQEGKDIAKFWPFQVNTALMAKAKPDAIFMHCLPAHRGEEVTDDVIDSPQSVVYDEAENRLHIQKAIMAWCLKDTNVKPKL